MDINSPISARKLSFATNSRTKTIEPALVTEIIKQTRVDRLQVEPIHSGDFCDAIKDPKMIVEENLPNLLVHKTTSNREFATVEVGAVSKVLTVLEKQLRDVNSDVEISVMGVCRGFQGMALRAQAAVNAAQDAMSGSHTVGNEADLISEMRSVLESLVDNVQSSCEFSQAVSIKLGLLESRLAAVETSLKEVEAIARKAKFVAFNGQIEAGRLGDAGLAVGVVAKETKALASEAAQTSDSIRSLVNQLATELKSTTAELKLRTEVDRKRFVESDRLAQSLLNSIHQNHQKISTSLGLTGKISGELRSDIAQAVVSMQFQDRVSQRIEHVIGALDFLTARIQQKIPEGEGCNEQIAEAWLSEIGSHTTMESERRVIDHNRQVDIYPVKTACEESSVELF